MSHDWKREPFEWADAIYEASRGYDPLIVHHIIPGFGRNDLSYDDFLKYVSTSGMPVKLKRTVQAKMGRLTLNEHKTFFEVSGYKIIVHQAKYCMADNYIAFERRCPPDFRLKLIKIIAKGLAEDEIKSGCSEKAEQIFRKFVSMIESARNYGEYKEAWSEIAKQRDSARTSLMRELC